MKTATIIVFFVVVLLHVTVNGEGAAQCYVCIDDKCNTNPGIQNCKNWVPDPSSAVCVGSMRKYSFGWSRYKECETLTSELKGRCRDKDNEKTPPPANAEGCYFCRGTLCNVGW